MQFDQAIADIVCERIAEGESLRAICESDDVPSRETIRLWLRENEAFVGQYTRAREEQADHYADEIIEIADRATDANIARLKVDARKWKASKLAPKRYGDKVDLTSGGKAIAPTIIELVGVAPDGDRAA